MWHDGWVCIYIYFALLSLSLCAFFLRFFVLRLMATHHFGYEKKAGTPLRIVNQIRPVRPMKYYRFVSEQGKETLALDQVSASMSRMETAEKNSNICSLSFRTLLGFTGIEEDS